MDNDMIYTLTDEKFGSIGVIKAYGEPWFVVNDVFKIFEYDDFIPLLPRIDVNDINDKIVFIVDTSCRKEVGYAVNAKGLFAILDYMMVETLQGVLENDDLIIVMREKISQFEKWILAKLPVDVVKKYFQ